MGQGPAEDIYQVVRTSPAMAHAMSRCATLLTGLL
jgi:hypothetical protein